MDLEEIVTEELNLPIEVLEILIENNIAASDLHLLQDEDIRDLLPTPMIGIRVRFREQLRLWKNRIGKTDTAFKDNDKKFDLNVILDQSIAGKDILKNYKEHGHLNERDQTSISRIIVDFFISKGIKMDPKTMISASQSIIKLFPSEVACTYYVPRMNNKKPSGKIFDRYFNCKYNRKKASSVAPKKARISSPESNDSEKLENAIKIKSWLLHNQPSNIIDLWKETSFLRMKERKGTITEIFENWPRYKDPIGCELISLDFSWLFPGKDNMLFEKIAKFENDMRTIIFPEYVKDKLNKYHFDKIQNGKLETDTKYFHLFNLIHAVIVPPRISSSCKPSISDAQNDMVVHLVNFNNLKQKMDELREVAIAEKLTLQPKVIAIGESVEAFKEFYVYLDEFIYKVPTLLKAFDLVVKMSFVFNLKYSAKSRYAWMLLQEYIYEIPLKKEIPKIKTIISKLTQ